MFKVTADGIMSTFNKTIDKLEALSEACSNELDTLSVKAEAIERAVNDATQERHKAKRYAGKLKQLMED